jgi:hypothetical protein
VYVPPEDGDRIQSPKRGVLNNNRTMDNVQKYRNFIKIYNGPFENVAQFKYLGTTVRNQILFRRKLRGD